MRRSNSGWLGMLLLGAAVAACGSGPSASDADASASAMVSAPVVKDGPKAATREGSAIVRAPQNDVLFVADEDHNALRILPLPIKDETKVTTVSMPGRPAQVLASGDRVLVTVRDLPEGGGGLVILKREGNVGLNEVSRVALPADAWGMGLSADESFVVVTSAWTHRVSVVDLKTAKVRATVEVGREPRGVVILPDGKRAYISHLMGGGITRIDGVDGEGPTATRLEFPAAPLRAAAFMKLEASLGYTVVASPKGDRLFFARHALGALGPDAWFGTAAVDVWLPSTDAPLVPARNPGLPKTFAGIMKEMLEHFAWQAGALDTVETGTSAFVQPRAAVYRVKEQTLLVASEGTDALVELDAMMMDPTLGLLRQYPLSRKENKYYGIATRGGAPTGIALSAAEDLAYVYCRTTDDVVVVRLVQGEGQVIALAPTVVRLTSEVPDESLALGRSLFYNATDEVTSGGLACSGCHPEGRDDGHVWHETTFDEKGGPQPFTNFLGSAQNVIALDQVWRSRGAEVATIDGDPKVPRGVGYPRQTPMLAGRVAANGPYGWHSESKDLPARIVAGFGLHRWQRGSGAPENMQARAGHLAKFLREGLVAPVRPTRPLTDEEQRGKTIFESAKSQCTTCHVPATGFTDRAPVPLVAAPTPAGFVKEENAAFKTPSLLYVGGTAPYFHDGRFESLEVLVEQNADRMGKTAYLTADEKKALVAYLETL